MDASRRALLGVLLAWLALPAAPHAEGLSLHVIPASLADGARIRPGQPLHVRAWLEHPEDLARAYGRAAALGPLDLELGAYPQLEPVAPARFRDASFVVDFDTPEVTVLHDALTARFGAEPTLAQLREFTAESIPSKSDARGWDLASRVARSGTGDCTEHAVLLAALARSVGRSARVAVGVWVATRDGEAHAFGHAWTEIHDGTRWTVVDATGVSDEAEAWGYLPLAVLTNEGPGYAIGLARVMQRSWVRRIEVRGSR